MTVGLCRNTCPKHVSQVACPSARPSTHSDARQVSSSQLAAYPFSNNFRPPQPLNGRRVHLLSTRATSEQDPLSGVPWGYGEADGPSAWPASFGKCGGRRQSPINIEATDAVQHSQKRLAMFFDDFVPVATNNGHTVKWDVGDGSMVRGAVWASWRSTPLESSRRGGRFELRRTYARVIGTPPATPI